MLLEWKKENLCKLTALVHFEFFSSSTTHRSVVKLGEHDLETKIDCENEQCADLPQIIYIKTVFVPKEYDENTLKHDIAIVELAEPANITRYVEKHPNNILNANKCEIYSRSVLYVCRLTIL